MKKRLLFTSLVAFSLLFTGCADDTSDDKDDKTTNNQPNSPFTPNNQPNNNQPNNQNTGGEITCAQVVPLGNEEICLIDSYGNAQDDAAVRNIFNEIKNFYAPDFPAEFYLYAESQGINAFYTQLGPNEDYIFFGGNFFYTYKNKFPNTYLTAITGVMAHEFGHNIQYNTYVDESQFSSQRQVLNVGQTVVLQELEADAFSGLYMYFKFQSEAEFDTYFQTIYELGDDGYTNPGHHGTPEQRQAAAAFGFLVADEIIKNNLQNTLSYADIRIFFVSSIMQELLFEYNFRDAKKQFNLKLFMGTVKCS